MSDGGAGEGASSRVIVRVHSKKQVLNPAPRPNPVLEGRTIVRTFSERKTTRGGGTSFGEVGIGGGQSAPVIVETRTTTSKTRTDVEGAFKSIVSEQEKLLKAAHAHHQSHRQLVGVGASATSSAARLGVGSSHYGSSYDAYMRGVRKPGIPPEARGDPSYRKPARDAHDEGRPRGGAALRNWAEENQPPRNTFGVGHDGAPLSDGRRIRGFQEFDSASHPLPDRSPSEDPREHERRMLAVASRKEYQYNRHRMNKAGGPVIGDTFVNERPDFGRDPLGTNPDVSPRWVSDHVDAGKLSPRPEPDEPPIVPGTTRAKPAPTGPVSLYRPPSCHCRCKCGTCARNRRVPPHEHNWIPHVSDCSCPCGCDRCKAATLSAPRAKFKVASEQQQAFRSPRDLLGDAEKRYTDSEARTKEAASRPVDSTMLSESAAQLRASARLSPRPDPLRPEFAGDRAGPRASGPSGAFYTNPSDVPGVLHNGEPTHTWLHPRDSAPRPPVAGRRAAPPRAPDIPKLKFSAPGSSSPAPVSSLPKQPDSLDSLAANPHMSPRPPSGRRSVPAGTSPRARSHVPGIGSDPASPRYTARSVNFALGPGDGVGTMGGRRHCRCKCGPECGACAKNKVMGAGRPERYSRHARRCPCECSCEVCDRAKGFTISSGNGSANFALGPGDGVGTMGGHRHCRCKCGPECGACAKNKVMGAGRPERYSRHARRCPCECSCEVCDRAKGFTISSGNGSGYGPGAYGASSGAYGSAYGGASSGAASGDARFAVDTSKGVSTIGAAGTSGTRSGPPTATFAAGRSLHSPVRIEKDGVFGAGCACNCSKGCGACRRVRLSHDSSAVSGIRHAPSCLCKCTCSVCSRVGSGLPGSSMGLGSGFMSSKRIQASGAGTLTRKLIGGKWVTTTAATVGRCDCTCGKCVDYNSGRRTLTRDLTPKIGIATACCSCGCGECEEAQRTGRGLDVTTTRQTIATKSYYSSGSMTAR